MSWRRGLEDDMLVDALIAEWQDKPLAAFLKAAQKNSAWPTQRVADHLQALPAAQRKLPDWVACAVISANMLSNKPVARLPPAPRRVGWTLQLERRSLIAPPAWASTAGLW